MQISLRRIHYQCPSCGQPLTGHYVEGDAKPMCPTCQLTHEPEVYLSLEQQRILHRALRRSLQLGRKELP
jgi:transposase-like protein